MASMLPYPSTQETSVTMPAAGASISAPIGAVTSIPSCGRARCRIGCTRIAMNALVSHPLVGLVERSHEDVGAPGEGIDVEPRCERLLSLRAKRLEAVTLRPGAGRPADPRLLDHRVGGCEACEQSQLLLALPEPLQCVAQP